MSLDPDQAAWIAHHRRRAQLLSSGGVATPGAVVRHLVAVQSQEHGYARWSIAQRVKGSGTAAEVDRAFEDGHFLRTHVLRPTWHYVVPEDLGWLMRLSGPRLLGGLARRHRELELDAATLARATGTIATAVEQRGHTRRQLAGILQAEGIDPGGQRIPHLLMHAELQSVICSGPMAGKQHTYLPFDQRVPPDAGPEGEEALALLAQRYFTTRGPATLRDFVWWSGLRVADARRGLEVAKAHLTARVMDDREYFHREGEHRITIDPDAVDLIQCYDESIIAYSESRDVLQTGPAQFPVPLNSKGYPHVILHDARLLGRWRRRDDRTGRSRVETDIEVPLSANTRHALDDSIDRYLQFADPEANR